MKGPDALLPRPRGHLPGLCATALAVIVTTYLGVVFGERGLTCVAMMVVTMTLGALLHGLCLLPEELLHHATCRYRSRVSDMLVACGLWGRTLLTAGIAGLIVYLTRETLPNQHQLWETIILTPVLYALLKSLRILGPCEVEVSDICEKRKMNVAHGLAWSFYVGYLQLVLPRFEDSITKFCANHRYSCLTRKLLILVPLNTRIPEKLEDEDSRISFYDNLPTNEINRAGIRARAFKHSVYIIHGAEGKVHECVVEYATPLLTLFRMSQDRSAGFGEPERRQQVLLFYRTLQDILDQSLVCRNRYTLLLLPDDRDDDPHFLSKTILKQLEQQEKEEVCILPPVDDGGMLDVPAPWIDPMSREPTIMMSLEKPLPLREPTENTEPHFR